MPYLVGRLHCSAVALTASLPELLFVVHCVAEPSRLSAAGRRRRMDLLPVKVPLDLHIQENFAKISEFLVGEFGLGSQV